jgi:hypothetical protein
MKDKYIKAFKQSFELNDNQFEIKQEYEDGSYISKVADTVYKISSYNDIVNYCKNMLISVHEGMHIPIELWIEIVDDIHKDSEFHSSLLYNIKPTDNIAILNLAFTLASISHNPISSFWQTLYNFDEIELYPNAIISAAAIQGISNLSISLANLMIDSGEEYFTELQDGIFEIVELDENEDFYIYTIDPAYWEI